MNIWRTPIQILSQTSFVYQTMELSSQQIAQQMQPNFQESKTSWRKLTISIQFQLRLCTFQSPSLIWKLSDFLTTLSWEQLLLTLFKDATLASKPCIIKASPKSNKAVVWVDIWDSQSGSTAKNIINCCFNIGSYIAIIQDTNTNLGIPHCKNCWKWGHSTLSCCSHISRCTKCYRAHTTEHHREKAWCCMENKKADRAATKEGELCSHVFKCINCKGDHQVDSYSCPY